MGNKDKVNIIMFIDRAYYKALVLRCSCDILSQFVLRPKIQLRFCVIFLENLDLCHNVCPESIDPFYVVSYH